MGKDSENEEEQLLTISVVLSLWEGQKCATSIANKIAVVSVMAECATFLMLTATIFVSQLVHGRSAVGSF